MTWVPDRSAAYQLMCEYTQQEGLQRHMLSVEIAMRAYAVKSLKKRKEDKIKADAEQNRIAEAERLQKKEAETLRKAEVERLQAAARAKRNEQISGIKEKVKSVTKLETSDNAQRIKSIKTRVEIVLRFFAVSCILQYLFGLINQLMDEKGYAGYASSLFYGGNFCLLIWIICFCTSCLIESLSIIEAGNMKRHHKAG